MGLHLEVIASGILENSRGILKKPSQTYKDIAFCKNSCMSVLRIASLASTNN